MDAFNRRLLILSISLALILAALIYLRRAYFESDFQVKYETAEKAFAKGLYRFTADASLYHFSSHEGKMLASADFFAPRFLADFPSRIGEWRGEEVAHQYADISLFRLYHHPKRNDYIWVMIVYGSHQSQFHSAEVCYIIDGWDVAHREIKKVKVADEVFPIRYFIAQKNKHIHLGAYWYLWPNASRRLSDGALLFRLAAESNESEARGEAALKDFLEGLINVMAVPSTGKIARVERASSVLKAPPAQPPAVRPPARIELKEPLNWILAQRVPNAVVPFPHIDRRYLLLSYELNPDRPQTQNDRSYRYIFSRSAIYDDAIGLIALSMARKYREAEGIIEAFSRIIRNSGELWFSYNTHDDWPSEGNHDEAIIRNGASAWAGYAIVYHLQRRLLEDPDILVREKNYQGYLNLAKKIADAVLKDQILKSNDPRYGLITGGIGAHEMMRDERSGKVFEKFQKGKIEWASIEHNLDIYFFLKHLAALTQESRYEAAMEKIKSGLLRAWNEKEGQFNRGIRLDGPDSSMALDCASWGLMFALSLGDAKKVKALLAAVENYEISDPIEKIKGHRPYYKGLVYDELAINKLIYPHKPEKSWADIQMVWSEGSLGAAMAYLKSGKKGKARDIIGEILKMRSRRGGIHYSTREIPFQFSPSPSMAGTAWLAMVLYAMEDPRLLDLFWK